MMIQHNINSLNAWRNWQVQNSQIAKSIARISSGYRINSAADDPAGMAISEKMKMRIAALRRQQMNVQDGMSALQVADGALSSVNSMMQRMTELATQAATGTLTDNERKSLNEEYQQLLEEIDRVGSSANFNGVSLFGRMKGSHTAGTSAAGEDEAPALVFTGKNLAAYLDGLDSFLEKVSLAAKDGDTQALSALGLDGTGSNSEQLQKAVVEFTKQNAQQLLNSEGGGEKGFVIKIDGGDITIDIGEVGTGAYGLAGSNLLDAQSADKALQALKKAGGSLAGQRGSIGAYQNRLEHTMNVLSCMEENLTSALSRILDTDMAKEIMSLTRAQMLSQVSSFVMAYGNHQQSDILKLLQTA